MKRIILFVAIIALLLGGGFYYWLQAQKIDTVVVTTVLTSVEGLIGQIIKGEGLDAKNKLNIVYKSMFPGDVERSVYNRDVEVGAHGALVLAKANLEGKEIRAFSPFYYNVYSLLVLKDSPYNTIEELKGKKIAILPKVTAAFTGPQIALRLKSIFLENDFQLLFGNPIEVGNFLDQGEADAAFFFETLASKKIATGKYREILEVQKLWRESTGKTFPYLVYVAFDDWLESHKQVAKKYRKSFLEAANLIVSNPEILNKYKNFLKENLGIETDEELRILKERLPRTLVTKWDKEVMDDIKFILAKAVEFGLLPQLPQKEVIVELK